MYLKTMYEFVIEFNLFIYLIFLLKRFWNILIDRFIEYDILEIYIMCLIFIFNYITNFGNDHFNLIMLSSTCIQQVILINIKTRDLRFKHYWYIIQHSILLGYCLVKFLNNIFN